jgi:glutaconate CoA-transferase subunit B
MLEGRGDVFDVFFAGGLQIDAFGNTNLERIGEAARPRLKGPGGVGLPFLPLARRVLIYTTSHDARTLVEKVDFVSGPAHSLSGQGPVLIVTPLCTMDFDPSSRRARLRTLHPGVSEAQVRASTGFQLPPATVRETELPSDEMLEILRQIDSGGLLRLAA